MTATHVTRAWSCTVRLVVDDPAVLAAASADLDALLARVDRVASRFRPDSALSSPTPARASPRRCRGCSSTWCAPLGCGGADTDGAVDPTVGLALLAHRLRPRHR